MLLMLLVVAVGFAEFFLLMLFLSFIVFVVVVGGGGDACGIVGYVIAVVFVVIGAENVNQQKPLKTKPSQPTTTKAV